MRYLFVLLLAVSSCGAYTCQDLGIVIEDAPLGKARVTLTCDAEPILTAEGHLELPTSEAK